MRENDKLLINNVRMNASITSSAFDLVHKYVYCIQAVWTGAGVDGTFKLQASNDNSNWEDIASSATVAAGAGSYMWNVNAVGYRYVKVVFTKAGASDGYVSVTINVKGA